MSRSRGWVAGGIALAVAGGCLALYQTGAAAVMVNWLAGVVQERHPRALEGLRFVPELQHAWYAVGALAAAWLCLSLRRTLERVALLLALVLLTLTWCPVLAAQGILFEPVTGVAAVTVSGLLAMMVGGTVRAGREARLQGYLAGRLTRRSFDRVLAAGDGRQLTGQREISAVTCQMLNHAALADEMKAEEMEDFSSSFLKVVAEFLVGQGGYLDECDVHRVRVLFGFPVEDANHAVTASRAALELRQRTSNLVREMEARWNRRAVIGCSVVSGKVTTGLFGFRDFEFFTAVGRVLEEGEALCRLNGELGSQILVNGGTLAASDEGLEVRLVAWPEGGSHVLRAPTHGAHELLGLKGGLPEVEMQARDAFEEGVVLLQRGDKAAARQAFQQALRPGVEDAVLNGFLRRAGGLSVVLEEMGGPLPEAADADAVVAVEETVVSEAAPVLATAAVEGPKPVESAKGKGSGKRRGKGRG